VGNFAFYLEKLKGYFKYIVLIDGSGKHSLRGRLAEISVDLLIAPYVGESESSQALPYRVLAGPNYYILGCEYSDIRRRIVKQEANKLLITCGGSDPLGVSLKVLTALKLIADRKLDVRIAIGPYFKSDLKAKICSKIATIQHVVTILNEPPNLAKHMLWCDLAIANTGLTKYELATTGTPALFLSINQEHADVNIPFLMEGTGIDLGVYNSVSEENIANKICSLLSDFDMRQTMAKTGQGVMDGHGAERIIAKMELLKNAEIRI
ncbi:hypothetical protein KA005_72820, partial [bacterium]|nr:hypothetical protein [bacterium]